jgi:hypothetical protein
MEQRYGLFGFQKTKKPGIFMPGFLCLAREITQLSLLSSLVLSSLLCQLLPSLQELS